MQMRTPYAAMLRIPFVQVSYLFRGTESPHREHCQSHYRHSGRVTPGKQPAQASQAVGLRTGWLWVHMVRVLCASGSSSLILLDSHHSGL